MMTTKHSLSVSFWEDFSKAIIKISGKEPILKGFFMKVKIMILGFLMCMIVLLCGHAYSSAQTNERALKIGVVSVERVLRDCKATAEFREQLSADNKKMAAEEEKLSLEIKALSTGLQSGALKVGSSDHLAQYKQMLQKQAELDALKEFNPRQSALKQQQWTQGLYQKILQTTKVLALEKDLILVLERSEPEFPIQAELGMIIGTHKVLYSGGCLDITNDVIAKLDAEEEKSENEILK
jgi:Skp family chaperone for outer membrane proteins